MPMVKEKLGSMGIVDTGIDKGLGTAAPDAPAPYVSIGWLTFTTVEEVHAAFAMHGGEIMADIANYTDIAPQVQISEIQ